ncbi:DUF6415 family natural product biosynthesis protein [Streptomyces sp. NPDC051211]|uniref:DUF6415 family natural product biosynthesis protein n=1 Tax=Streptomyces sp. NPDC051211 TaxID=3154643 RepID=UPI00345103B6
MSPEEWHAQALDEALNELRNALTVMADGIEREVEAAAEKDIMAALAMKHLPPPDDLADLTSRLITHGITLAVGVREIPPGLPSERGLAAADTWARLTETGPKDGPLGNWSYARQLAAVSRSMLHAIRAHRCTPPAPDVAP